MNDNSYPFDEDIEKIEIEEEEASENVLRNERESMWDSVNRGIEYINITREQLL